MEVYCNLQGNEGTPGLLSVAMVSCSGILLGVRSVSMGSNYSLLNLVLT